MFLSSNAAWETVWEVDRPERTRILDSSEKLPFLVLGKNGANHARDAACEATSVAACDPASDGQSSLCNVG
jgi:hypothetical protein